MLIRMIDNLYIVKLYKNNLKNLDIYNIDDISLLFKEILIKLKTKYKISGFCLIEAFVNNDYGMIMEINNIDKYGFDIDVKIKFHVDSIFMSEINSYDIEKYDECYFYSDKYYAMFNNTMDSEIIYKDVDKIIKNGVKVK